MHGSMVTLVYRVVAARLLRALEMRLLERRDLVCTCRVSQSRMFTLCRFGIVESIVGRRYMCSIVPQVVHATAATDDKKLQSCLKKLSVNTIPGIEEVNMIKDDGTVIHFNNPKAQASLSANTFAITGHGENKQITEMLPGILSQLGPEGLTQLKRLASTVAGSAVGKATLEEDDEVPDLVENFDEASKEEVKK